MNLNFGGNHFELFGLTPAFAIDRARLDRAYREIQSQVHPDRYASASDTEKRLSMQWTTRANEAYQTLREPLSRARHLLELHGVDTGDETNAAMPAAFLMQQMELREAVIDAKAVRDQAALSALESDLQAEQERLLGSLVKLIDADRDYPAAAALVRELQFLAKLDDEIGDALEAIDNA